MMSLKGLKGTVEMSCFLCVTAVWQCKNACLAGIIFMVPGPWGYWKLGACTSDFRVRMVTAFPREIGMVSIRESPWLTEPTG
jgi:hypothetical protein